ncbi:MAG: hypothetical protein MUE81_13680 [Thermoflexibacter sp.]|nr:hypothetical protein [Thermoflexibacter sp.]
MIYLLGFIKYAFLKPLLAVPLWGLTTNRVVKTLTVVEDPVSRFSKNGLFLKGN